MNNEIASSIKDQEPTKKNSLQTEFLKKMTKNDKKEYSRLVKWRNTPTEKQRRFSTNSKVMSDLMNQSLELSINHHRFQMFLKEMSLVYIITEFEEFLKDILGRVYSIKPQILKDSDKVISFPDILSTKDKESLIGIMIDKEIKSLINKDIEDISKYLKKQFKIDLSKYQDWNQFKERFYRRHVLIHNHLYPDEQYKSKTGYKGKYTRLKTEDYYIKRSISLYKKYAKIITDQIITKFG